MEAATRADAGIDYVEEYAAAATWFADHLVRTSHRLAVPTCPDWTVLDLVTHIGNVHSWAATIVETGRAAVGLHDEPPSTKSRRLTEWYLGKAEDLYTVLRDTPSGRPCWNFAYGAGVAGFWQRRQLHETLLHGVDLAIAGDHEERLPVELAADGVDEVLTVFLHRMHWRGYAADLDQPLAVRATDHAMSWVVEPAPRAAIPAQSSPAEGRRNDRPSPHVTRGMRPGIDVLSAPADVLVKLLWKRARPTDPAIEIDGDEHRVLRFLASRLTP